MRLGPGRERFSDVDTMSFDERRSGSISFASPRRAKSSRGVNILEPFTRRNGDTEPSEALSQSSVYYDARDAQASNRSANSSPSLPNTSPTRRDYFADRRPPSGAFGGPGGSPRHPGLKEYDSPPATHPILGANSPRRLLSRGGNDQEGTR